MAYIVTMHFLHQGRFASRVVKTYEDITRQQMLSRLNLYIQSREFQSFELESLHITAYSGDVECLSKIVIA